MPAESESGFVEENALMSPGLFAHSLTRGAIFTIFTIFPASVQYQYETTKTTMLGERNPYCNFSDVSTKHERSIHVQPVKPSLRGTGELLL